MDFSVCMPLPLLLQSSNPFSSSSLSFYHLVAEEEENLLLKVFVFTPPFSSAMGTVLQTGMGEEDPVLLSVSPFPFTLRLVEMRKKKGMYKMVCVRKGSCVLAPPPSSLSPPPPFLKCGLVGVHSGRFFKMCEARECSQGEDCAVCCSCAALA